MYSHVHLLMRRPRIRGLYRAGDVAGLVEAMDGAPLTRRLTIVALLQQLGTAEAEAALFGALSDSNSFVRSLATGSLAKIDPDRDPWPVIQALRGDPTTTDEPTPMEVIKAALYLLPRLDTVPILIRGLNSDDHWTRQGSANALAELPDPRALSALAAAQSDPDKDVRSEARKAYEKTIAARK